MNLIKSRKWNIGIIIFAMTFLMGSIFPIAVYAQETKDSFIEYSFDYSNVKSDISNEGSGNLRLAVLENFGNGTLRIETSGWINNAEFEIKNNVAEDKFSFPYLVTLPQLDLTIPRENGTISIHSERLSDEIINFQGTNRVLNVSKIIVEVESIHNNENVLINVQGELKIFSGSGLLYSFDGSIQQDNNGGQVEVSVTLLDTNLNIENKPESSLNIFSQINTLSTLGMGITPVNDQVIVIESSSPTTSYLVIGSLVGIISILSVAMIVSRRKNGRSNVSDDKPLHWVH